jgi:hypothetical protein
MSVSAAATTIGAFRRVFTVWSPLRSTDTSVRVLGLIRRGSARVVSQVTARPRSALHSGEPPMRDVEQLRALATA